MGEVNTTEETGQQNGRSKPQKMSSGNKGKLLSAPNKGQRLRDWVKMQPGAVNTKTKLHMWAKCKRKSKEVPVHGKQVKPGPAKGMSSTVECK